MAGLGLESKAGIFPQRGAFATTHWSVVTAAGKSTSPEARHALERLCAAYWYPLYAFVRRQGLPPHDAEDATQGFLAWLIASRQLRTAVPGRGKFRSFLLVRLKHFLSDERKRQQAQKRGGPIAPVSLDAFTAEERYRHEPAAGLTPEKLYERRWALTLLERTILRLQQEYVGAGRGGLFDVIKQFHAGEPAEESYREAGERLGLSEGAVKSAVFRLRRRHRELLRDEIAQTVATAAEVDEELRALLAAVRSC